jgi:hypothetical protein
MCAVSDLQLPIFKIVREGLRERNTYWPPFYKRVATELVPVQVIAWPRQLFVRATQSNDFTQ